MALLLDEDLGRVEEALEGALAARLLGAGDGLEREGDGLGHDQNQNPILVLTSGPARRPAPLPVAYTTRRPWPSSHSSGSKARVPARRSRSSTASSARGGISARSRAASSTRVRAGPRGWSTSGGTDARRRERPTRRWRPPPVTWSTSSPGPRRALAQWLALSLERSDGGVRFALDLREVRALLLDYFARDLWPVVEHPPDDARVHLVIADRSASYSGVDRERARALAGERVTVDLLPAGHFVHVNDPGGLVRVMLDRF